MGVLKAVGIVVVGFVLLVAIIGGSSHQGPAVAGSGVKTPTVAAQPPVAPTPPPKPQLPDTLDAAIAEYKPLMADEVDTSSQGAVALALWCGLRLHWSDVAVKTNETTPARVRKDVDAERGKKMCTPRGRIIQIEKENTGGGATPSIFSGLLLADGAIIHFYATGSTGTLVEGDGGRLCGVVTGRYDYHNSGGGSGHAVELVGMFDLPENRAAH